MADNSSVLLAIVEMFSVAEMLLDADVGVVQFFSISFQFSFDKFTNFLPAFTLFFQESSSP